MLAKVNDTPAVCVQLDLLLQPKYTQVIQGSTIEFKIESDERQEVSEVLRLYFHQTE